MIKKDVTVTGATLADLPELMRLAHINHAEGGLFAMDEELVERTFRDAIEKRQGIIGVIRASTTEIAAMMFLLIARQWYTQQFHIEELFNFVAPEHRRSNYADAMIRYARHVAISLDLPLIIGVLTSTRMEAKVRLYRRQLGMPAGAFFVDNSAWPTDRAPHDRLWRTHPRSKKRNGVTPIEAAIATATLANLPMVAVK